MNEGEGDGDAEGDGEADGEGEADGFGDGLGEVPGLGLGEGEGEATAVTAPKPPRTVAPCFAIMKMFFCASMTNFTSNEAPLLAVAIAVNRPPRCSDSPNVPARFAVTL